MANTVTNTSNAKPLVLKQHDDQWPQDLSFFYMLAESEEPDEAPMLFKCRRTPWFESSVPVKRLDGLARHRPFLKARWPRVPYRLTELAVGFFTRVQRYYGTEAMLLLCWDRNRQRYRLVCPRQTVTVVSIAYDIPVLPAGVDVVADLHSHLNEEPEASFVDVRDGLRRASMIYIIWSIDPPRPPRVSVEAVIDSYRFKVPPDLILESGYKRLRLNVPPRWMHSIHVDRWGQKRYASKEEA